LRSSSKCSSSAPTTARPPLPFLEVDLQKRFISSFFSSGVQNTNGRQISEKVHIENAEEIGKEFVKEFYNCVAVKPSEAYRFFSHESIALLEDGRPFGGQVVNFLA